VALKVARGASFDGLTLAGLGITPEGKQQPWVARFDSGTFVPEPASMILVGFWHFDGADFRFARQP
jgi:hypothetical protein